MIRAGKHLAGAYHFIGATLAQKRADLVHDRADPDGKPVATVIVAVIGLGFSPHGCFVTHVADS
jgi:hypothetical protein